MKALNILPRAPAAGRRESGQLPAYDDVAQRASTTGAPPALERAAGAGGAGESRELRLAPVGAGESRPGAAGGAGSVVAVPEAVLTEILSELRSLRTEVKALRSEMPPPAPLRGAEGAKGGQPACSSLCSIM